MKTHLPRPAQRSQQRNAKEEQRKRPQAHSQKYSHNLQHLTRRHGRCTEDVCLGKDLDARVRNADEG